MDYQTGDIVFIKGKTAWSDLIRWFSFGKWSHVTVVSNGQFYETDGAFARSVFSPISKYDKYERCIIRYKYFTCDMALTLDAICKQREGTKYGYGDIALRALLFWMNEKVKGQIAEWLGSSNYTICYEEVAIVEYASYKHPMFEHPSKYDPQELFEVLQYHRDFEVINCEAQKINKKGWI
jgi:hypothetical protein